MNFNELKVLNLNILTSKNVNIDDNILSNIYNELMLENNEHSILKSSDSLTAEQIILTIEVLINLKESLNTSSSELLDNEYINKINSFITSHNINSNFDDFKKQNNNIGNETLLQQTF